ncbi:MAG TPA: response regulator transcription factor [Bacteroidales bacterium]|nr:response regulator transcription factor [Bacteroidales bacterium]
MNRILIIEDDPDLNRNIKEVLTEELMFVEVAFDGLLAEKILKREAFDCVVLDINLPGKNGYNLCTDFRKYNFITPVIMLTAFDELEDKIQGYECGADDYLTKPFYMKELIMKINALIRRNRNAGREDSNNIISGGDILINQQSKVVTRQGVEITLTPREYHILLRLIQAKGELVDKKELIKEIWGSSINANTNTIEVFINFLRKKIDKPFGKDSIKTKIGFGYYFDCK